MKGEPVIIVDRVSHHFGAGALRKQILFEVSATITGGEIVILTGPSGSGKTTLLTLMGALRSTQEGSLTVLGQELRGANEATLVSVRRRIGFIFQLHNLLAALTVSQNVMMGLPTDLGLTPVDARTRAREMLASVGLEQHLERHPEELSGGQKQRVAIARALAARPRIILADEPTASPDKKSGRDVVDRLHELAKQEGTAVVLVTHDNRILDVAGRIIHLEEGRLSSFAETMRANTQQLLASLAKSDRMADLLGQVETMGAPQFAKFLEDLTGEARQLLQVMQLGTDEAFGTMLAQVIRALTIKAGQLLRADRSSLLLADEASGELVSLVTQEEGGKPLEIRIPATSGIAGHVYTTGTPVNVPDAYAVPFFNPDVDRQTGYRTRSVLCTPVRDADGRTFAVMTLLNKHDGATFGADDERTLHDLTQSIGVVLHTWHQAMRARRAREGWATRAPAVPAAGASLAHPPATLL